MGEVVILPCTADKFGAVAEYCRDFACAASDRAAHAAHLASIDAQSLGFNSSTSAYVQYMKVDAHVQVPVTLQLLRATFSSVPVLTHLLLVRHTELQPEAQPGLSAAFSKAMHSSSSGLWLYECSRRAVLPPLQVRHAKVEDHDDLLPMVAAAAAGACPSLAALPESCKPDQPFALTRLIGSQDEENVVLVAEDQGKLVGLLVATSQLDLSLLLQSFDLGPFDGFLPAEVYEACEAAAQQAAAVKAEQRLQEQQQQGEEAAAAMPIMPTEEDVRKELLPLLLQAASKQQHGGSSGAQHSLLAVTMLCMLPGYEARAVDFMLPAFREFAGKDYYVLSLPHSEREPPLASFMSRLPLLPGSPYPEVLLLGHRAGLAVQEGAWEVRLAVPDDVVGLHGLIGSLANAVEVQEAFLHALGRQGAVVAVVQGQLVAMAAITPAVDLQLLQDNFNLAEGLPADCCNNATAHAELDVCVVNPVFSKSVGALLAGVLHLLGKSHLHYALLPGQAVPDWLGLMQQQPPRHSSSPAAGKAEFALYSFSKHMAYAPKQAVNSQIVIAGASQTALSCLEQLLLQRHISFNSLTLLAPGGVPVGGVACTYTAGLVARMGVQAAVTIVDGQMASLDIAQKLVGLDDGSQLPYDLLVVATGLQDQLGPAIAAACPEAAHFVLSSQALIRGSISAEAAASLSSVLLYGADLQAFDVVAALTDAGVSPDAITWVCPDQEQQDPLLPLLTALAGQLQLELPSPQQGQLVELLPTQDGARAVADLQACNAGPVQQLELDLLVGCGRRGPSAAVARCLGSAGLVCDGRLVVDAGYKSSDAAVMGAGPAAKFSRRYTLPEVMHEHYSSTDVGASLAAAIVDKLASPAAAEGTSSSSKSSSSRLPASPGQLPPLTQGRVMGCRLPGGRVFAFAGCPAAVASPGLAPPPGGRSLISKCSNSSSNGAGADASSDAAVINICIDGEDVIHHVAYLGPGAAAAAKLAGLVGLPFSYLAAGLQLPAKQTSSSQSRAAATDSAAADAAAAALGDLQLGHGQHSSPQQQPCVSMRSVAGVVPGAEPGVFLLEQDVLQQLSQPWAQLLFHDGLVQLRQQLLQQQSLSPSTSAAERGQGAAGCVGSSSCEVLVQDAVVELLRRCGAELPGYKKDAKLATAFVPPVVQ
uniref:Cilia- and flagella-associated protein 61 N-terminal domain-containing protein n=1 Tax=Tetradesmus obliquus TaxID=3088 RepID=A0A383WNS6_TETOB|eukprot:jgi/Sobl393_1/18797/SZX79105.1